MSTSRPFAYNTGSTISGTIQLGDLAIGVDQLDYTGGVGGVRWWEGPDEDLGYVICRPNLNGNQPNPDNVPAYIRFLRSKLKTEESFVSLVNTVFEQSFSTGNQCKSYLDSQGYWNSWVDLTPTPTPTNTVTPTITQTPTNTITPTVTPSNTPTPSSAPAGFTVTVSQVGPNVVWSGSGSFNLTDLTVNQNLPGVSSGYNAPNGQFIVGPSSNATTYTGSSFTTFATSFGTPGGAPLSSTSGSVFGIVQTLGPSGPREVLVPQGYTSGTVISGSATYNGQTIAGMGLTSGTYVWQWGSGAGAGQLTLIIE